MVAARTPHFSSLTPSQLKIPIRREKKVMMLAKKYLGSSVILPLIRMDYLMLSMSQRPTLLTEQELLN
jgi:hypothetical protein